MYENDERVALSTNVLFGVQSVYMKQDELTGMYYDYAMAAPLMLKDKPTDQMDVLILGMGTGTYATQCRKYFGDMNIEGVEIDEKITEIFLTRRGCSGDYLRWKSVFKRLAESI